MWFEAVAAFIRDALFFMGRFSGRSSFPKPLPPEREAEMLAKMARGDDEARRTLIEHNLRLVAHVAKKFQGTKIENDDLISLGTIGLIKAVNTYKTGQNTQLATYAAKCVENEILMFLRSRKKLRNEVSINDPVGVDKEGKELTHSDILGTSPDEIVDEVHRRIELEKVSGLVLSELDERERLVFNMRYGLADEVCHPQREVADMLGISRSYVSRIEKKALEKLKRRLDTEI